MPPKHTPSPMIIKDLGLQAYEVTWKAMKDFTQRRFDQEMLPNEIWLVQHFPVFTQGQSGKSCHLLNKKTTIPIIQSDRGGQITYHGPGQLIAYVLLDLKAFDIGVKSLVTALEQSVIKLLSHYHLKAYTDEAARGVYLDNAKIASIGLRVRKHFSYHGLSLNIAMDLTPFRQINPCGYRNLAVTQLSHYITSPDLQLIQSQWVNYFINQITSTKQTADSDKYHR